MSNQEYNTEVIQRRETEKEQPELEEVFETLEEEEQAELEYRELNTRRFNKLIIDEEETCVAIDAYHDDYFYQYVNKQSVIVWIKWYKTRYLNSDYISADQAERELYELQLKYNMFCRKRDYDVRLAKLRKEY